ncbi:MAG: penicillin-binding protein activator LpoB [Alphaproteobacteria bacterium]|nr:penicillin-binding protein activator LpoB [Alphaproteobacteria bacterium]
MKKVFYLMIAIAFMGVGCSSSPKVLTDSESQEFVSATLSSNDFEVAAQSMLNDMLAHELASPKPNGQPYIMKVSEIVNDTQQRLNMRDLTMFITKEVRRSGNVKATNSFGSNRNSDVAASRELAESSLVDKSTVKKNNTVKAFDLSLTGRISQKNTNVDRRNKLIEYTFDLSLTDVSDGTELWSDYKIIKKLVDKDTQTW